MANTFLFAQGTQIGKSLAEKEMADTVRAIVAKAKVRNCRLRCRPMAGSHDGSRRAPFRRWWRSGRCPKTA